ncbi:MAG: hypothetical protein DMG57_17850 [Acidobacteria bacterium]|nr:MAG: hypothetical protein DMG57_17850 [Acidobacteriota bacterium]
MLIGVYLTLSFWLLQGLFLKSSSAAGVMAEGSYLIGYLLMWVLLRGWGTKKGILFQPPKSICDIICRLAQWTPHGYSLTAENIASKDMPVSFIFYFSLFLSGTLVPFQLSLASSF